MFPDGTAGTAQWDWKTDFILMTEQIKMLSNIKARFSLSGKERVKTGLRLKGTGSHMSGCEVRIPTWDASLPEGSSVWHSAQSQDLCPRLS